MFVENVRDYCYSDSLYWVERAYVDGIFIEKDQVVSNLVN